MIHVFDTLIAEKYGLECAIILQNIYFWIEKNIANNTNFFDGKYWTYNSVKAFSKLFKYMSESTIRRTLKKIEDEGLIITGNYNKSSYDRTTWYALTEKGFNLFDKSICQNDKMEVSNNKNGFNENDEPIPYINTYNKPDNNTDNTESKKKTKIPLIDRDPVNDIEKVEKAYLVEWKKLYDAGKLSRDKPLSIIWTPARKMINTLMTDIGVDQLCDAVRKASTDDWIISNGFSLTIILSTNVLNRLLNSSTKQVCSKLQDKAAYLF